MLRIVIHDHTTGVTYDKKFDEAKHKRNNAGEFGTKNRILKRGIGAAGLAKERAKVGVARGGSPETAVRSAQATATEGRGLWKTYDPKKPVPKWMVSEKGKPISISDVSKNPETGWRDVQINHDPKAHWWVKAHDSQGRDVGIRSPAYRAGQDAQKFQRIRVLDEQIASMKKQNDHNLRSPHERTRELAELTHLIMVTGARPGSERDTKAKFQAYGASTLQGQHVIAKGATVHLKYVPGKSHGVEKTFPPVDAKTAEILKRRAKEAGPTGKLFQVKPDALRKYVDSIGTGEFDVKDFRTHLATTMGGDLVKEGSPPTNRKQYIARTREVFQKVSNVLGNDWKECRDSYVHPEVFQAWRDHAGVP